MVSILQVDAPRRELFDRAAVCVIVAMGTAVGNPSASTIGLGCSPSVTVSGGITLGTELTRWRSRRHGVPVTGTASVPTGPFGCTERRRSSELAVVSGLGARATMAARMLTSVFVVAVVFAGLVFGVPMDAIGRRADSVMFIDVMRSALQMSGAG